MVLAGLLLIGYQYLLHPQACKLKKAHLLAFFMLGLVSIYLSNIAEIWGLQYMSSAKACLIYSLSPFIAALFAYWFLHEKLNLKKWLGLCIGFVGVLPIFFTYSAPLASPELFFISWPEVALIIAVLASVYGWISLKKIITDYHYSPILANGISMLLGGGLALLHSYLRGESWTPLPVFKGQWGGFLECTLWMMLVSNIICYNLYGYLLKRFSATFMSLAGLVTPLFASLFGWYFLNETITWHFFASMILFSIGLLLFYQQELRLAPLKPDSVTS